MDPGAEIEMAPKVLERRQGRGTSAIVLSAWIVTMIAGLALGGCLTPPAMLEAPMIDAPAAMKKLSAGAENVSIVVESGTTLRGWFVPADPGAPVVLHLLESGSSVNSEQGSFGFLTRELSGLGFASLAVDYTGVGISDGKRSCEHLARDAKAMWEEAVRRAGGDPSRVILRATSIGTLAAGSLIASGARPGGIVLLIPVSARTVVRNFGSTFYSPAVGLLGTLLYKDVIQPDLADALEGAAAPMLAVSSPDEQFVGPDERRELRSRIEHAGGEWVDLPGGHLNLTLKSRELFPEETRFLRRLHTPPTAARLAECLSNLPPEVAARFPEGSDERARLELQLSCVEPWPPFDAAAVALTFEDPLEGRLLHRRLRRIHPKTGGFDALLHLCSLDDPGGRIPVEPLDALLDYEDLQNIWLGFGIGMQLVSAAVGPPTWIPAAAEAEGHTIQMSWAISWSSRVEVGSEIRGVDIWRQLSELGRPRDVVRRQFSRILLKCNGYPERVRTEPDGAVVLECMKGDVWVPLDLTQKTAAAAR